MRFRRCMVRNALANGKRGQRKWGGATLVTPRRTSVELRRVYERAPLQRFTLIAATHTITTVSISNVSRNTTSDPRLALTAHHGDKENRSRRRRARQPPRLPRRSLLYQTIHLLRSYTQETQPRPNSGRHGSRRRARRS